MINFLKSLQNISPALLFEQNNKKSEHINAMTTPLGDFLFIGGLSLLFLPLVFVPDLGVTKEIAFSVFVAGFFINNPHFMHSYQLLYGNFWPTVKNPETPMARKIRFLISGIISPVILLVILLAGILQVDKSILGFTANMMFFLVGWHYVKQGYGVLITMSVRQKIFYSEIEKKIFLYNGYISWICFWAFSNGGVQENLLYGIPYVSISLPNVVNTIIFIFALAFTISFFIAIYLKYERDKQFCLNGVFGYISAVYIWLIISSIHPVFILAFPALHSLQYLLFVWKIRYEKIKDQKESGVVDLNITKYMRNFFAVSITLGAFGFYIIPRLLDIIVPYNNSAMGTEMFLFSFIVFINVHHYFIDFAIWRRDNPDMKYLFR